MLLKLPEAVELELKNVDELLELTKNEIRDQIPILTVGHNYAGLTTINLYGSLFDN
jgi:hypothetical protein